MRQLTCTDRPYKATARLALAPEYSTYCTLAVQRKVPYARRCTYSEHHMQCSVKIALWRLVVGDYRVRRSTCNLSVIKSVHTYKASECKRTIIRLHCAISKALLWNMEYVAVAVPLNAHASIV